jgi:hypothetical protein
MSPQMRGLVRRLIVGDRHMERQLVRKPVVTPLTYPQVPTHTQVLVAVDPTGTYGIVKLNPTHII